MTDTDINYKPLPETLDEAFVEILALRSQVARLKEESTTDALTRCLNRRGGVRALQRAMKRAERTGRDIAVVALDIDHFKNVNDTYGHEEGDLVLERVSEALRTQLRETDALVRMGGEEFLVVTDNQIQGASVLAEKLRSAVEATCFAGGDLDEWGRPQGTIVTISLGVAQWDACETSDALLRRADENLYRAKGRGRNVVVADHA